MDPKPWKVAARIPICIACIIRARKGTPVNWERALECSCGSCPVTRLSQCNQGFRTSSASLRTRQIGPCFEVRVWANRASVVRGFVGGVQRLLAPDSFQPNFSPVWVNASGAEHSTFTVPSLTHDRIQNEARPLHLLHFPGLFIDDLGHSL